MESRLQNETTIRDYLLGRVDADPRLVERMDEQMLTDAEFSETVDIIEDEIIEEYLEGELNSADKQAVEQHFLRPPERQRKLQSARLLNRHFQTEAQDSESAARSAIVSRTPDVPPSRQVRSHFRTYLEIAAGVLLVASVFYVVQLRRDFQTDTQESSHKLAQERERSATLTQQLQEARNLAQPPTVMLSLLQPGARRGDAPLPELHTGPGTKTVRVDIALQSASPGAYDVRLEIAGKTVWSRDHIPAFTSAEGAILMFNLPAQALTPGESRFVVRRDPSGNETSYIFLINNIK